jgi:cytidylate kinase
MAEKGWPQRQAEAVVRAGGYRRGAEGPRPGRDPRLPRPFTVALSREVGAGGTRVANAVGERLRWPVYDQELLVKIAQEMNLRLPLVQSVDERHMSWLEEVMEGWSSAPAISESGFVRHLVETVLALASHGECLIVGRGAAQLLPAATTLRVRLVADLNDRVEFIRRDRNLSREEAARYVAETERERVRFIKGHFGQDPADPHGYDLVLNTSRYPVDDCAELIVAGLRRLEARAAAAAGA